MSENTAKREDIKSIEDLLNMEGLVIPHYQRPYKWTIRNMSSLLDDIEAAIEQRKQHGDDFRYRVGTIILHQSNQTGEHTDSKCLNIVDGQQRIISLLLIKRYLIKESILEPEDGKSGFIEMNLSNRETQKNLRDNYAFISKWFKSKSKLVHSIAAACFPASSGSSDSPPLLEAVVITVSKITEAFQLFDSQNTRGKALEPHDLLKAYHLREMDGHDFETIRAVTKWESESPPAISELLKEFLFRIMRWADKLPSVKNGKIDFSGSNIDIFKGISNSFDYTYALRATRSMPCFQITEPFIAGADFFAMVDHYLAMLKYLRGTLEDPDKFPDSRIRDVLSNEKWKNQTGFRYAKALFECALLCYYDRFGRLDEQAVNTLFTWAFMLRVDLARLKLESIDRYARGVDTYTNKYSMFSIITRARLHTEISNLDISTGDKPSRDRSEEWNDLQAILQEIYEGGKSTHVQ